MESDDSIYNEAEHPDVTLLSKASLSLEALEEYKKAQADFIKEESDDSSPASTYDSPSADTGTSSTPLHTAALSALGHGPRPGRTSSNLARVSA